MARVASWSWGRVEVSGTLASSFPGICYNHCQVKFMVLLGRELGPEFALSWFWGLWVRSSLASRHRSVTGG